MNLETETENLPKGTQPEIIAFTKIADESSAALKKETTEQIKRKPGRPPGPGKKTQPEASQESVFEKPVTSFVTDADKSAVEDLAREMQPLLKDAIKTPFALASDHFNNSAIEITSEEAETPSYYLAKFLKFYFPEIEAKGPKVFSLYAFIFSMGLLLIKKIPKMRKPKIIRQFDSTVASSSAGPTAPEAAPSDHDQPLPRTASMIEGASFFEKRATT